MSDRIKDDISVVEKYKEHYLFEGENNEDGLPQLDAILLQSDRRDLKKRLEALKHQIEHIQALRDIYCVGPLEISTNCIKQKLLSFPSKAFQNLNIQIRQMAEGESIQKSSSSRRF